MSPQAMFSASARNAGRCGPLAVLWHAAPFAPPMFSIRGGKPVQAAFSTRRRSIFQRLVAGIDTAPGVMALVLAQDDEKASAIPPLATVREPGIAAITIPEPTRLTCISSCRP